MVFGYKCFKKGLVNNYGVNFSVGQVYHTDGDIVFGVMGNGFHICERLEDTLRFFDTFNEEVDICSVIGMGECVKRNDEYNGYYDMYACEKIYIMKKLLREEIIAYGLSLYDVRAMRFLSLFKLTSEEKILFRNKFKDSSLVSSYIDYYQDDIKDVFVKKMILGQ